MIKKNQIDILELKNVITENKNTVDLKADCVGKERVNELRDRWEDSDPEWTMMRQKYKKYRKDGKII